MLSDSAANDAAAVRHRDVHTLKQGDRLGCGRCSPNTVISGLGRCLPNWPRQLGLYATRSLVAGGRRWDGDCNWLVQPRPCREVKGEHRHGSRPDSCHWRQSITWFCCLITLIGAAPASTKLIKPNSACSCFSVTFSPLDGRPVWFLYTTSNSASDC